jgi:hypothetical protein
VLCNGIIIDLFCWIVMLEYSDMSNNITCVEVCFGWKYNLAQVTLSLLYTLMHQIQSGKCLCQGLSVGTMAKLGFRHTA